MKDIRIALVIANCPVGEIETNLASLEAAVQKAADGGAGLICFPELNVTGYCNRPELAGIALAVDGAEVGRISRSAQENGIVILAGFAERAPSGKTFASHLVFSPDGKIGLYRKLHIAPPEKEIFLAGQDIPVFCAAGVRFSIQLCYDAHFPELAAAAAVRGAEILFIPHASPRGDAREKHDSWMRHLPARAFDNSVFVAACNQVGENCKGLSFPGNAVVIGPSGDVIAADTGGKESILFADLKSEELERVRGHEMRYFLPNRRPELYR